MRMGSSPRGAARRVRRRLARWLAPEVEAELRDTRRRLKRANARLRRERTGAAHGVPPDVEATIARVRDEHLTYLKPAGLRALAAAVLELEDRSGRRAS